jgi:hypothetical protein
MRLRRIDVQQTHLFAAHVGQRGGRRHEHRRAGLSCTVAPARRSIPTSRRETRIGVIAQHRRNVHFASIPDLSLARRAEAPEPIDNRRLARSLASGSWVRVTSGVFVPAAEWDSLAPMERHRVRVREVMRRRRAPVVLGLFSAAALWGIDVLGDWPDLVDVFVSPATGGRSSGAVRRFTRRLDTLETVELEGHRVTSPAQTALDLARVLRFEPAVAAVDQALWAERVGGALTTRDSILHRLDEDRGHRGDVRAARAIAFAESLAANVRESQSRVVINRLGFPRPRLQERRLLLSGRLVFGDLYFPVYDHWCEIDGRTKYTDPAFLRGRTPAEAVIDEKNRENEIRREVRAFSRWEPTDADHPRIIWDILTRAGLPTSVPRP